MHIYNLYRQITLILFIIIPFNIAGNVVIKVFDVLGSEVKELVNEFKQAGVYSVNFNAVDLSSSENGIE